jgi:pimeloyl-ACP methyl ester carboxylesterase
MNPPRFTKVGDRLVTWRAAGAGPAAVLLHGSPQSSRALAGLGAAVAAAGLAAIMPDTPGAGHSDPLARNPLTIPHLADALADFLDTLGLSRIALYGTHTGAAIALAFAARHPARVTTLILDGIAAWTDEERARYRHTYAPPFLPTADGSHLTWLWSRMEAQSLFFPWHDQSAATWRGVDLSPPWHLHRNAMDMLDSGDAYRAIYLASLAFDPAGFLPVTPTPVMLTLASDVLRTHATRPALAHLPLHSFESPATLWSAIAAHLAANPGDPAPTLPAPTPHFRGTLSGSARPLVLLHPAGASSRIFAPLLATLPGPIIAPDLPGHGYDESECPTAIPDIAAGLQSDLQNLGLESYAIAGPRLGGIIAHAMASPTARAADLGPRAADSDLATNGAVDLSPQWDGTHLIRAWRAAWRMALFDPWYKTEAAAARQPPENLSPAAIHAAALDLLRAAPAWAPATRLEAEAPPPVTVLPGSSPPQWTESLTAWRS